MDLIFDPFTGSSTTGIMALELEKNLSIYTYKKEYLDLSLKRFKHKFGDKKLQ